jgi:hypothetical protein
LQTRWPQESLFSQLVVAPGEQVRPGQADQSLHSFQLQTAPLQPRVRVWVAPHGPQLRVSVSVWPAVQMVAPHPLHAPHAP